MLQGHFLRQLDRFINFSFIYQRVERMYSQTGRRSIDPIVIVKMLLLTDVNWCFPTYNDCRTSTLDVEVKPIQLVVTAASFGCGQTALRVIVLS